MERQTLIEHLSALIGQTYTAADHAAVVVHLADVEKLSQDVIAMREREQVERIKCALDDIESRRPVRSVRPTFYIDPDAAEI